jgi:hypothetical protein
MQNAFLVRLSISTWTARKLDKNATREAKARAGADEKAGVKVYKSILATEALDAILTLAGAARTEHRKRTVPWAYDGPGAITAEGYPAYKAAMARIERDFTKAVIAFYAVYAEERAAARDYLGAMFDETDYPTTDSLRSRFAFSVHAEPMPQANDFRVVGLPEEDIADIKQDIIEKQNDALENANANAWTRVVESVEKLKLRLQEYTRGDVKKFYDSWLDNVQEIIGLIPSINITNDPALARMQQRLTSLTAYSSADLKDSEELRNQTVKQATIILDEIGKRAIAA